jgi:hypothetical protein
MTGEIWKLGQWRQTLEDCPANAYLIGEKKPIFNDAYGKAAEEKRLKYEIAKFKLKAHPDCQIAVEVSKQVFEETRNSWESVQEAAREAERRNPTEFAPAELCSRFRGPKNQYVRDSDGQYVPNPAFVRHGQGRHHQERGRGQDRGHRQERRSSGNSRSRSHHLDWRNFE